MGAMVLPPGQVFGRYRIEGLLGQGGMGTVYRAFDATLHRPVALKLLRAAEGEGGESARERRARILREARAAAAIAHPNAVAVYDIGQEGDQLFLTMELITGQPLRQRIGDTSIPLPRRLEWLVDVARVLHAAHAAGVVHRDIKPENVMIRHDGVVKVLDFGLARLRPLLDGHAPTLEAGPSSAFQSAPGTIQGTPAYMPPEQLHGGEVDGRVDQFAWGVMAYELLAGHSPWGSQRDLIQLVTAVLTVTPPPLVRGVPGLLPEVGSAVERCLQKDREQRFADMGALLEALGASRGAVVAPVGPDTPAAVAMASTLDLPTPGPVPAPVTATQPPAGPRVRWAVGAAAAIVVLVGLAAIGVGRRAWRAPATTGVPDGIEAVRRVHAIRLAPGCAATTGQRLVARLSAHRDGTYTGSRLTEIAEDDPGCATAQVYAAFMSLPGDPAAGVKPYLRGQKLRDRLDGRDRALLDASGRCLVAEHVDYRACAKELSALRERYPRDVLVLEMLGMMTSLSGDAEGARTIYHRILALDPDHASARSLLAQTDAYSSGPDGRGLDSAEQQLRECIRRTPATTWCRAVLIDVLADRGDPSRCAKEGRALRKVISNPRQYAVGIADVLAAGGAADDVILEILRPLAVNPRPIDTLGTEAVQAGLAVRRGDFDLALRLYRGAHQRYLAVDLPGRWSRITRNLLLLLEEVGDEAGAAEVADPTLRKLEALPMVSASEDWAIADDPLPALLTALRVAGRMPAEEYDRRLSAWESGWRARAARRFWPYLWVHGHASGVRTADQAAVAIQALSRLGGTIPAYLSSAPRRAGIGRTLLLAGKTAEAVPELRKATSTCWPLQSPVEAIRANLDLGLALEKSGDRQGACAALARVIEHWGAARPRSVSAEAARQQARALSCPGRGDRPDGGPAGPPPATPDAGLPGQDPAEGTSRPRPAGERVP
jgi:serine/threonine-protein kinase